MPVDQICVGDDFSLVLLKNGALFGWGKNTEQQLGFYDEESLLYVDIPTEITTIKEQEA